VATWSRSTPSIRNTLLTEFSARRGRIVW
jgi:hypothetical protein